MFMETRTILAAEDNADDVFLLQRAFTKARLDCNLQIVSDGEEALAYLRADGKYADRKQFPFPSLLLLDIKMPKLNGLEVLKAVRSDPELKRLRVVMFTTSTHEHDRLLASELHANSFLLKPTDPDASVELLKMVENYWFTLDRMGGPPKS